MNERRGDDDSSTELLDDHQDVVANGGIPDEWDLVQEHRCIDTDRTRDKDDKDRADTESNIVVSFSESTRHGAPANTVLNTSVEMALLVLFTCSACSE